MEPISTCLFKIAFILALQQLSFSMASKPPPSPFCFLTKDSPEHKLVFCNSSLKALELAKMDNQSGAKNSTKIGFMSEHNAYMLLGFSLGLSLVVLTSVCLKLMRWDVRVRSREIDHETNADKVHLIYKPSEETSRPL